MTPEREDRLGRAGVLLLGEVLGGRALGGIAAGTWQAVAAAGPQARAAAVPAWAIPELLVTAGARLRLLRWSLAGAPDGQPEDLVLCSGHEPRLLASVTRVFARFPPPVRWHCVQAMGLIGVAARGGWQSLAPVWPEPTDEALQLAVVSMTDDDADLDGLTAHELAHGFLTAPFEKRFTVRERRESCDRYYRLAVEWNLSGLVVDQATAPERHVTRFLQALGFEGRASDTEGSSRHARQYAFDRLAAARPEGA